MFNAKNPAAAAAGELGLLTTALAVGAMGCHERGLAAVEAGRQRRQDEARARAEYLAYLDHEDVADVARAALEEVARLQVENANLKEICQQRQAHIDRIRNRPRPATAA